MLLVNIITYRYMYSWLLRASNGTVHVHVGLHESGTLDDSVCVVQKFVKCGTRTPHTLQPATITHSPSFQERESDT